MFLLLRPFLGKIVLSLVSKVCPSRLQTLLSQNDLQAFLDDQLFANIFNSSAIYNQARLRAVVHCSGVSSAWLAESYSLTISDFSPHDFVTAVRLWLGVPLFLCYCFVFDDHLLGCSHGPLRIQYHNALVSVHHARPPDHFQCMKLIASS